MAEVPRITVDEVRARRARGEPVVFLDARNPTAWASADRMVPGAIRVPPGQVGAHLGELPRGPVVLAAYCT